MTHDKYLYNSCSHNHKQKLKKKQKKGWFMLLTGTHKETRVNSIKPWIKCASQTKYHAAANNQSEIMDKKIQSHQKS